MDDNQQPQDNQQQDQNGDTTVRIGKYNVKVIRSACISAASCVAVSPNVFELDGENLAVIKDGSEDTPENIVMAAQSCPTKAIEVYDAESGAKVWPEG
jgi:ferredoxin